MFMITIKRITAIIIVTIAAIIGMGFTLLSPIAQRTIAVQNPTTYAVIIDAGHGSFDGGASTADGTLEKDLNLAIALKIRDILVENNISVGMTRESDAAVETDKKTIREKKNEDLRYRKNFIENSGAKVLVSIHMNTFEQTKYRGAQVFYSPNMPASAELAKLMQTAIINGLNDGNTRTPAKAPQGVYLLQSPPMPAILIECGFLTNPEESTLLQTEEYQLKLAKIISQTILEWLTNH